MTKSWVGMMVGVAGAALATWYWTRRDDVARGMSERGEVIFRNTPLAAP